MEKATAMKSDNYEMWRDAFALAINYPTARRRCLEENLHWKADSHPSSKVFPTFYGKPNIHFRADEESWGNWIPSVSSLPIPLDVKMYSTYQV
jgi:hypothetical protein